ncbi:hypothetical protein CEXT_574661 [Caerostris extrusa]|uniref:Uncharacterized protein n=1 Tax=Caerostris extrusa TaxID=172846 RepID=A0AAV4P3Z5_CAEEX|nr:hypothetical protein CEXT_574661 [Caerostris extrusa]
MTNPKWICSTVNCSLSNHHSPNVAGKSSHDGQTQYPARPDWTKDKFQTYVLESDDASEVESCQNREAVTQRSVALKLEQQLQKAIHSVCCRLCKRFMAWDGSSSCRGPEDKYTSKQQSPDHVVDRKSLNWIQNSRKHPFGGLPRNKGGKGRKIEISRRSQSPKSPKAQGAKPLSRVVASSGRVRAQLLGRQGGNFAAKEENWGKPDKRICLTAKPISRRWNMKFMFWLRVGCSPPSGLCTLSLRRKRAERGWLMAMLAMAMGDIK